MATCNICGQEVEFRHVGGYPQMFHFNGRCEPVSRAAAASQGPFRSPEAFSNPNAHCPVCGQIVFYYQNAYGSRVYFEERGWPWTKHGCTDNPASQRLKVKRIPRDKSRRTVSGINAATLFELAGIEEAGGFLVVRFSSIANHLIVRKLRFELADLEQQGWQASDFKEAPSFVITRDDQHIIVHFISARRRMIGRLTAPRPIPLPYKPQAPLY